MSDKSIDAFEEMGQQYLNSPERFINSEVIPPHAPHSVDGFKIKDKFTGISNLRYLPPIIGSATEKGKTRDISFAGPHHYDKIFNKWQEIKADFYSEQVRTYKGDGLLFKPDDQFGSGRSKKFGVSAYFKRQGLEYKEIIKEIKTLKGNYKYITKTDIRNFFPSIYTHSFEGISSGGKTHIEAKKIMQKMGKNKTPGESFDFFVREMRGKRTDGLLVGPNISAPFAEFIARFVDEKIKTLLPSSHKYFRYYDDIFIIHNKRVSENIFELINDNINQFSVKLYDDASDKKLLVNENLIDYLGRHKIEADRLFADEIDEESAYFIKAGSVKLSQFNNKLKKMINTHEDVDEILFWISRLSTQLKDLHQSSYIKFLKSITANFTSDFYENLVSIRDSKNYKVAVNYLRMILRRILKMYSHTCRRVRPGIDNIASLLFESAVLFDDKIMNRYIRDICSVKSRDPHFSDDFNFFSFIINASMYYNKKNGKLTFKNNDLTEKIVSIINGEKAGLDRDKFNTNSLNYITKMD